MGIVLVFVWKFSIIWIYLIKKIFYQQYYGLERFMKFELFLNF